MTKTIDDAAFRAEVRDFIGKSLPPGASTAPRHTQVLDHDLQQRWHRILAAKSWAVPAWPVEHGGTGWSRRQLVVFDEELAAANAPPLSVFIGMIGPVLNTFGDAEQRARHLPPLIAGEAAWCQGYSEPGSGSDLASLRARAVRDGDDYIVTGQKIWTTFAHHADWMFCLVRTSDEGPPQRGVSFLLIDMRTPGVEVRPIVSIDGLHHLNEVWFHGARVPASNRVGPDGGGWGVAKFLLEHERDTVGSLLTVRSQLEAARRLVAEVPDPSAPIWSARSPRSRSRCADWRPIAPVNQRRNAPTRARRTC